MKEKSGISLIVLVITIIILTILALVSINLITDGKIIEQAKKAVEKHSQMQEVEEIELDKYLEYINIYTDMPADEKLFGDAEKDIIATELSTIDGKMYSAYNPIIPEGFMPINTETSNWEAKDLVSEVKKGLVISDGINDLSDELDANGKTKYKGVFYEFEGCNSVELTDTYGPGTQGYREPSYFSFSVDMNDYMQNMTTPYQEAFDLMAESVDEYEGFYVGRYKMGINSEKQTPESNASSDTYVSNWLQVYNVAGSYSSNSVVSEMIWGCQYDAMLRWMQSNNVDMSECPNDDENITNNIYDFYKEVCTQEKFSSYYRVYRGGYMYSKNEHYLPKNRMPNDGSGDSIKTRFVLWVRIPEGK